MTARENGTRGEEDLGAFELGLRQRLAEGAREVYPAAAPYPAIVERGRRERRRRLAAAGAALVVLGLVPVVALALPGRDAPANGATVTSVPEPSTAAPAPPTANAPAGPGAPATPGQLADGITMAAAAEGLEQCLAFGPPGGASGGGPLGRDAVGKPEDYRILLAHRSTGNDNSPGDGRFVVAVKDGPTPVRLICRIVDGEVSGRNTSSGRDGNPERGAVVPDMNGGKLFLQRLSTEGPWKLPYRWGSIGTVDERVARVTVTYGGATVEAALDHGWFAATGILERSVVNSPRIKGYDAQGKQIYDSDGDRAYDRLIP
ncbi:hypothetical protein [Streptomyces sp. NPDC051183]|uniref:hypothetical protein n=1 Tax=Streptomyces sp. NPDC051183 TaxID=3155165 RepID=UPI0034375F2C